MTLLILLAFVFLTAGALAVYLSSGKSVLRILDTPNKRSLHVTPMPRTGGVAILFGVLLAWFFLGVFVDLPSQILWMGFALVPVAIVSIIDDIKGVSPVLRLLMHGFSAVVLISAGMTLQWGFWSVVLTWFGIVWMVNLYNFMDGMDGFAGGMSFLGFGFLGLAGYISGNETYAYYAWAVSVSALGFLVVNFPPAKIFMGDVGSVTLGLLASAFSLWGIHDGLFSVWLPVLVFSPFVVDATVTIVRRGLNKEKVWEPHRKHIYQRLVQAGLGHRKTVVLEYVLMFAFGSMALVLLTHADIVAAGLVACCLLYALLIVLCEIYIHHARTKEAKKILHVNY
jgi:UDP-N-acetylmuramyl pentapeptide phosphotransferase/UDP-N-acetylglucosamine-1-phosphate transferase